MVYIKRNSKQAERVAWLCHNLFEKIKGQLCCKLQIPQQAGTGKEFLHLQVQGIIILSKYYRGGHNPQLLYAFYSLQQKKQAQNFCECELF